MTNRKEPTKKTKGLSLSIQIPISQIKEGRLGNLSKWTHSLIGITEEDLNNLNPNELTLMILAARDREVTNRESDVNAKEAIQSSLVSISSDLQALSSKIGENTEVLKNKISTLSKSYAEVLSLPPAPSCEQLRQVIRDEEDLKTESRVEKEDK